MHTYDRFTHWVGVDEGVVQDAIYRGLSAFSERVSEFIPGGRFWHPDVDQLSQPYWHAPFRSQTAPRNSHGISVQALVLAPHEGTGAIASATQVRGLYPDRAAVFPVDPRPDTPEHSRPTMQAVLGLTSIMRGHREPIMHAVRVHQVGTHLGRVVASMVHGLDEVSYHRAMTGGAPVQPYAGYSIAPNIPNVASTAEGSPVLYNPEESAQVIALLSLHHGGGSSQREFFESIVNGLSVA